MKGLILALPSLAAVLFASIPPAQADDTAAPAATTTATSVAAPAASTTETPAAVTAEAPTASNTAVLGTVKVQTQRLNRARDTLNPETGTSSYHFDTQTIAALPQGENTSLQNLVLQAPGVAKDSFGQLHVRGDHLDLQYRINGTIVPEFINGFGDALGTRFIQKMDFLSGSLPAQFGYRTAGVINITANSGIALEGGAVDLYGGSRGTFEPSAEYGGTSGGMD